MGPGYIDELEGVIKLALSSKNKYKKEYANEVREWLWSGLYLIPYKTIDSLNGKRKLIPNTGKYRGWLVKEASEAFLRWLLEVWQQQNPGSVEAFGIFLGPPSGYLIMFDLDSEKIGELFDADKAEWENTVNSIINDGIALKICPVETASADGIELSDCIFIHTRRGAHIITKLSKEDWETLHRIIGANKKIGTLKYKNYEFDVELRTLGPTPIASYKHVIAERTLPPPLNTIERIEKGLRELGIKLPAQQKITDLKMETSKRETSKGETRSSKRVEKNEKQQTVVTNNNILRRGNKTLTESDISKISEVLSAYWISGHRNNLTLGLLGWLIKRDIDEDSAVKLIQVIATRAGDEELNNRVSEVRRHYNLVKNNEKNMNELTGKTKLVEEIQNIIKQQNPTLSDEEARDRALAVINELEAVLGPRRTILVRTPYRTGTWFVNDPRRGIVLLKERVDENRDMKRYRDYISDWYIRKILVVRSDEHYIYNVLFKNARTKEKLVLSGQLDEVIKELRRIHGVKRSQVVSDAVSAIISELIRRRVARLKRTAEVAGILPLENNVKLVRVGALSRTLIPAEVDVEKAREALKLLEQIREHYEIEKFDAVINWAAYAPASYALKILYNVKQIHLLQHGEKQTGKTTLARIITALYPVVTGNAEEIAEEGQSEYRLAWKLNITSLPLLEDEVQGISHKPALLGLLKRAATGDIVRWRGDTNRRYHARAPLVLTSNYTEILTDPALGERVFALLYTQNDYVYSKPREKREEFKQLYNEYRVLAPHLGALILQTLVESWSEIGEKWAHRLQEKIDYLKFGQWIWAKAAEKLGVDSPEWAVREIVLEEEIETVSEEELFWAILRDAVRVAIEKHRIELEDVPAALWGKIRVLDKKGFLPSWMRTNRKGLIITSTIVNEFEKYNVRLNSLKGLAVRLGYEYRTYTVRKESVKGMLVPREALIFGVATDQELAEEIEPDVMLLLNMGKLEPTAQNVKNYIMKRYGVDEHTAYELMNIILDKYGERIRKQREELEVAAAN